MPRRFAHLALLLLAGCGKPVLSVDDAIMRPDGGTIFVAYVQRQPIRGLAAGLRDAPVRFYVAGEHVGSATTDRHGRARLECMLGEAADKEAYSAFWPGNERPASAPIFAWAADRPVIAVDIDDTICATDKDHLYLRAKDDSRPIPGSAAVLAALARDYEIFYVTARPRFLLEKTRVWLAEYGFPRGAVFTAGGWHAALRPERFKRRALAALRAHCPNLLIGIGNRPSDVDAYQANGMLAIYLTGRSAGADDVNAHTIAAATWSEIGWIFATNRGILAVPAVLRAQLERGTLKSALVTPDSLALRSPLLAVQLTQ